MNSTELKFSQRVNRIVIGTGLIVLTMALNVAPLGLLALIPLVATYPVFAGLYGYDPLTQWIVKEVHVAVKASEHVLKSGHTPKHS